MLNTVSPGAGTEDSVTLHYASLHIITKNNPFYEGPDRGNRCSRVDIVISFRDFRFHQCAILLSLRIFGINCLFAIIPVI